MQSLIQSGLPVLSSKLKDMDSLEKMRRWKRSFDGFISFRKALGLAFVTFVFILYVGPTLFSWLFGSGRPFPDGSEPYTTETCIGDKMITFLADIQKHNAHAQHHPWRVTDKSYVPYVGNGQVGVAADSEAGLFVAGSRHLSQPVPFKPVAHVAPEGSHVFLEESATLVHYVTGVVHKARCYQTDRGSWLSVAQQFYAHRAFPAILVQEVKMTNPGPRPQIFNVERLGISDWVDARSRTKTLEHGDGGQKYTIVSGQVELTDKSFRYVTIVAKKLPSAMEVASRMTQTLSILTAVVYSEPLSEVDEVLRDSLESKATKELLKAVGMTSVSLKNLHQDVWKSLWNTGFGISHSMAENSVNGLQINATMYYVLSQVPAPIHRYQLQGAEKLDQLSILSYAEGCYGGIPTLYAPNLWKSLSSVEEVNAVVKSWVLTLEKNGCGKLIKAGADGVVQAMVLSFAAFKFREDHLELNSQPKDLHRDYFFRRISYGNSTHLNISIVISEENKPVIKVALDRRDKDYFACDAGCLDRPSPLSTETKSFPVKLTDPITAILYITSDHQHMEELKEAIHVKEVVEAPAHEHHVIALHRHGNKLGGLPGIFWFSIGFLILAFHMFLFKLIWQEYCAGQDRFRTRKYSDYQ
ncbi:uncharacterized protein KIAA2013 homolog isoform X1 [Tigriopus californicus]|uniref:uncharacterized protein KIAA2013 homolog isoform X1 n=1 Tax=Tigriopus californicus TaxID=6832 RepID=UPI0027DA6C83|nr:uncharacterized protein KIAA2013 homolog isoform X1 [Tigriopus californicus]